MRAWRLLAAAVVGASLAVAGMSLQALLRNPLAEPYVLGISSGAGVGVLLGTSIASALVVSWGWISTPLFAAIGAILTAAVVYAIAQRRGRLDPYVLLLAGVIVNVINGALILVVLQFSRPDEMIHFIGWGMGQIPESMWFRSSLLVCCTAIVLACIVVLFVRSAAFNALGLGDDVAISMGVNVHRLRIETFAVASIMTSAAVALAGPVGFVGLIVPHVGRLLWGPDHRRLTIVSAWGGAIFLMLADTLCRTAPQVIFDLMNRTARIGEVPVGVLTALAGGPFFIILLRRRSRYNRFTVDR